jgi:hypothetical protein
MVAIGRQAGFSSCWCRLVASVVTEAILANTLDSIPSCSLLHGKSSQCHGENGKGADSSFSLPSIAPVVCYGRSSDDVFVVAVPGLNRAVKQVSLEGVVVVAIVVAVAAAAAAAAVVVVAK